MHNSYKGCELDARRRINGGRRKRRFAGQSSSSLGFKSSSISHTGLGSRGGRGRDEAVAAVSTVLLVPVLVTLSFPFSRSTSNGCGLGAGLVVTALVRRGCGARGGMLVATGMAAVVEAVVRDCLDNASWRRFTFTPPIPGQSASSSGVAFAIFANDYITPQPPTPSNQSGGS